MSAIPCTVGFFSGLRLRLFRVPSWPQIKKPRFNMSVWDKDPLTFSQDLIGFCNLDKWAMQSSLYIGFPCTVVFPS